MRCIFTMIHCWWIRSNGIISDTFISVRVRNIHDWKLPGKETTQMLENLPCISCPDGWRALRFLVVWEEQSRRYWASWLKADHSFWQSDGVNLWSGSVKQKICVHWSLITAACIRSLSYPDLCVRPGMGWEKSCVSQTKSDPRLVIQCRLEPLNFHLNSCAPSFRSNMAVPPLRMTVRRSGLQTPLWRQLGLWILMRRRGVQ